MAKIKNMGTATMKFNEGAIINGTACNPDGTDTDYALVVTGSAVFDCREDSGGISIIKNESDPVFVRFINDDDPTSWYAYMAMDSAENFYIAPGRSQDFYFITRENSGSDYYFPFRIFDNGKIKFHQAPQSSSDSQVELPADVVFSVSGSKDGQNSAVFGGDVVISGSLNAIQKHIQSVKYTDLGTADKMFVRWNTNGSNTSISVNNKFVCPAPGTLSQIFIRSTGTPGSTEIGFHRATDGTENPSSTAIETQTVDINSANTTKFAQFTPAANFGPGDVISVSVDPTNSHGNIDMTIILEFDFAT